MRKTKPNEIIEKEDHYIIKLYKKDKSEHKKFALIDKEDYEKCKVLRWSKLSDDYVINRKTNTRLHHFVLGFTQKKGIEIDHKNKIRLDCRKHNLRIVDRSQNNMNKDKQSNNTTGHKNIWYDKSRKCWVAEIQFRGKRILFKRCLTIGEAIKARDKELDNENYSQNGR